MARLLGLILSGAAAAVVMTGCYGAHGGTAAPSGQPSGSAVEACTAIGCTSGVTVDFTQFWQVPGDEVNSVRTCIGSTCSVDTRQGTPHLAGESAIAAYNRDEAATVSITLWDAAGRVLTSDQIQTEVRRHQPNGPGCLPVCYFANLRLDRSGKLQVVPTS